VCLHTILRDKKCSYLITRLTWSTECAVLHRNRLIYVPCQQTGIRCPGTIWSSAVAERPRDDSCHNDRKHYALSATAELLLYHDNSNGILCLCTLRRPPQALPPQKLRIPGPPTGEIRGGGQNFNFPLPLQFPYVPIFGMFYDRGHHHFPRFQRFLWHRKAKNAKQEVLWSRDLHGNGTNR